MPLEKAAPGSAGFKRNIKHLVAAGKPTKQAVAIAYSKGRDGAMVTAPNAAIPAGRRHADDEGCFSVGDMWTGRTS